MSREKIEIDAKEVIRMLAGLDAKLRKKAYRDGIRKSLTIVRKEAISRLRSVVGKGASRRKDNYGKTLESGVKYKVYKDVSGGNVNILGNYKLKWFELGTKPRYNWRKKNPQKSLKKKRFTGQIRASHFFTKAYESKEKEVFSTLEKNIADAIKKINNKQL